jgi:ubiquinone/menaquinone biosynthesis C-methylase UbiE
MPFFIDFLRMVLAQQTGFQQLPRTPEPTGLTDQPENVVQYNRVMTTKLAIVYAAGLEIVHRARPQVGGGAAVDLACGPGHYTLCLARYLGFDQIEGIDLSSPMVAVANANAAKEQLQDRVRFRVGDVTRLEDIATGVKDLASFTGAAHHLPDLDTVSRVLREMDRITKPDGLVMVMDLARLRTAGLTERYVNLLGADYVQRGLPDFLKDFRNTMYAAWTVQELRQAIPQDTRRYWCHIAPRGLPSVQIILGLPLGRKTVFLRSGFPWSEDQNPVPPEMRQEWNMMRWSLAWGSRRLIAPKNDSAP